MGTVLIFIMMGIIKINSYSYQLRRPIRYHYKKMILKADINPIISDYVNQQQKCSSKLGPYCSIINSRQFRQTQIPKKYLTPRIQAILMQSKQSLKIYKQILRRIDKFGLGQFLIASSSYKQIDKLIQSLMIDEIQFQETVINGEITIPSIR